VTSRDATNLGNCDTAVLWGKIFNPDASQTILAGRPHEAGDEWLPKNGGDNGPHTIHGMNGMFTDPWMMNVYGYM